jgi:hypothetical protein
MDTIQFHTTMTGEPVIHIPPGVAVPTGDVEVQVRRIVDVSSEAESNAPESDWLSELIAEIEAANPDLPSDMAARHDYYAHGKPLP